MDQLMGLLNWIGSKVNGIRSNDENQKDKKRYVTLGDIVMDPETGAWSSTSDWLDAGNNPNRLKNPQALRTPSPTQTPTPTPTQSPLLGAILGAATAGSQDIQPNITVPDDGGTYTFPPSIAQMLLNSFNDVGLATEAGQMLRHPMQQTLTNEEMMRIFGEIPNPIPMNRGENPGLETNATYQQDNGTWDRGLARNNSGSLADLMSRPFWNNRLNEKGIRGFDDMLDPQKSLDAGRILLESSNWDSKNQRMKDNPNWNHWYAAPKALRYK